MDEELIQIKQLEMLRLRHRELDDTIDNLHTADYTDELQVRRLKKERLELKNQISRLEHDVYPDIIA